MISRAVPSNLAILQARTSDLRATPGQFFLAVPPTFDPYLPRAVFPFSLRGEIVESLIAPLQVEAWARQGWFKLRGAFGRGFVLPASSRRALVLAANAAAGAHLIPVLDALVRRDCEVAALCGPDALDERWLPPEVEYRIVDDVIAASSPMWSWADAVFACGSPSFYDLLLAHVLDLRQQLESGRAQILLRELAMPCGTGVCYACALKTRRGVVLNCHDGPVFDLADWVSEA